VNRLRASTRSLVLILIGLPITWAVMAPSDYRAGSLAKQEVQSIYAVDPHDSWNRIFYLLFTRPMKFRVTEDFGHEGSFVLVSTMGNPSLPVTRQIFERIESGDRAIDPLYPNFLGAKGAESVLVDPRFSELEQALRDALAETSRPPLYRALMQADVWAAYDILNRVRETNGQHGERVRELLGSLDQFIGKLALTSEEIAALPRNYSVSQSGHDLPNVFDKNSGWMEVEYLPYRLHDFSADHRRAARVFLKPATTSQKFLANVNATLAQRTHSLTEPLDGAALVTEDLLIDSHGHAVPSPLTYEVQLRTFVKDRQGKFQETVVAEYELSRKLLLANPSSGGFIRLGTDFPAYLPSSGNDYSFASPTLGEKTRDLPILGYLRRRCESCHGPDMTSVFTFMVHDDPRLSPPLVRQLRPADDEHAAYVATEKMKQSNFKSLHLAP
jgi:hypothetical protein